MAYEIRERRPGYYVEIFPVVIECMGGGVNRLRKQTARQLETDGNRRTKILRELLKTGLAESIEA